MFGGMGERGEGYCSISPRRRIFGFGDFDMVAKDWRRVREERKGRRSLSMEHDEKN